MAIDKVTPAYFLGANLLNPKVYASKINEIIDQLNDLTDGTIDTDKIELANGSASSPSLTFKTDNDTGIYRIGANQLGFSTGGSLRGLFSSSGFQTSTIAEQVTDAGISFASTLYLTQTPQTLTGAGAVNLTTQTTLLVTTGANALTLAAGSAGQIKIITMKTDGGDGTLTPTGLRGGTTITFDDIGDTVVLLYIDSAWIILSNFGCTIA